MTFNLDGPLQHTAFVKFFASPIFIQGYFAGRFTKDLTSQECERYIQKKKNTLYTAVQEFLYDTSEVELTFVDEEAYNWWNNLESTRCKPEMIPSYYNNTSKPTGNYLLEVPPPPNKIFETE